MTSRQLEGIQISNSVEVMNFTYASKNVTKQLFETLASLDIESASNDQINTLKMQLQVLIKNNLPYSNNTNDGQYHNALLAMLYSDYKEITQNTVHPDTLTRVERNIQALIGHTVEYNNNKNRGDLTVRGSGSQMKMHINKQGKIVQLEPITNENQLMAA